MEDKIIYKAMLDVLTKEAEEATKIDPASIPSGGTKMTAVDETGTPVQVEKIVGPDGKEIVKVEAAGKPVVNAAPESDVVKKLSPVAQ